ncbi:hypothetical protein NK214_05660 [Chromobacterium sp. S0633]|uniref:hypothetical protein n=1 Tax=Chromobacterium sp. S0633 TaxID=2957805 RepID=UPI00209E1281|nr:hypothetical protein [Chromobacterium sp. S0633]MCP1289673.1 hypothetical protein [Chromobacterium sp. S0633]
MAQRLKNIFSRLCTPPTDGGRQVFTLSRADAERLPELPSIALISITAPERPPANIGDFRHVLRMSFADVDFLNPVLSDKARKKLAHAFTEEQRDAVCTFVEALPEEVSTLIIHCEGGYSRSCAIARALHQLYGYHVGQGHLLDANRSIVRVILGDAPGYRKLKRSHHR